MPDFSSLEKRLNIKFKNPDLLYQALVHRSYLNENPKFRLGHNERLEFLGDAVLEIVVTEYLYHTFPDKTEGDLTDWRASLVNAKMLAEVANVIKLEDHLSLSKGEAKDKNTKARQYILANAVEALIGAIYLDQGLKKASKFILEEIVSNLDHILANQLYLDPKSKFQEKAQDLYNITPHYEVISETGPDHAKVFKVGAYLQDKLIATGSGESKHEAQVAAAQASLKKKGW
ncbi:MAG: Ribonuclease 3 [Candidatus Falkowbacteria bacterium GW2011_GWA2_39_24]|uniref:Ribonuclease 3 n=1 Tax=Candidatus Falkowbacteria bacterium GW2011_GWA2_39_24 TaxID=1618634 RepID=A0A0G0NEA8_9BACT|nr:MAG: Ribonuclease 3 [Candidatus Falkowbacteria bacterium GW2011_GWA2_39_24]